MSAQESSESSQKSLREIVADILQNDYVSKAQFERDITQYNRDITFLAKQHERDFNRLAKQHQKDFNFLAAQYKRDNTFLAKEEIRTVATQILETALHPVFRTTRATNFQALARNNHPRLEAVAANFRPYPTFSNAVSGMADDVINHRNDVTIHYGSSLTLLLLKPETLSTTTRVLLLSASRNVSSLKIMKL